MIKRKINCTSVSCHEVNNPLYSVELKIDECVEFLADSADFRRFKVVIWNMEVAISHVLKFYDVLRKTNK